MPGRLRPAFAPADEEQGDPDHGEQAAAWVSALRSAAFPPLVVENDAVSHPHE